MIIWIKNFNRKLFTRFSRCLGSPSSSSSYSFGRLASSKCRLFLRTDVKSIIGMSVGPIHTHIQCGRQSKCVKWRTIVRAIQFLPLAVVLYSFHCRVVMEFDVQIDFDSTCCAQLCGEKFLRPIVQQEPGRQKDFIFFPIWKFGLLS